MGNEHSSREYLPYGRKKTDTTNGVFIGALVKVDQNASFWNGAKVERFYWSQKWYVTDLDGNKATLGKDVTGKYTMRIPISTNFLTVIESEGNDG